MKRTPEARPRFRRKPKDTYSSSLLVRLKDATEVDLHGFKAASLARLHRNNFPVPDGFVVTTKAFENSVNNEASVSSNLAELRENLLTVGLPSDLEHAILEKCALGLWAVRSSSTIEDGPSLSFAGQMDTFLNVSGEGILDAIRKVWASNFSERSLTYRLQARLDSEWPKMAVVIQRMATADKGGVLFTINPSDINDESMVISVAQGPKPDVVSGSDCETYYIARGSGYLLKSSDQADLLDNNELQELAKIGERIEHLFGNSMDIEWAKNAAGYSILQARPVTYLAEAQHCVWSNANVGESLPGVATPMTWSIIEAFSRRGFEKAFGTLGLDVPKDAKLADSFLGRIYLNLSEFVGIAKGIPFLSAESLHDMAGGGGLKEVLDTLGPVDHRRFWRRLPQSAFRISRNQIFAPALAKANENANARFIEHFFSTDLSRLQHDVLKTRKKNLDAFFNKTGELLLTVSSNFILSLTVIREAMKLAGKGHYVRSASDLLEGLHIQSSEAGTELIEIARFARQSFRLRQIFENNDSDQIQIELRKQNSNTHVGAFNRRFKSFIQKHGNRAVREAELATPRWREDASFPISIIKSHVSAAQLKVPTKQEFDDSMFNDFSPAAKVAYQTLVSWARYNAKSREKLRATLVETLGMQRVFLLECGRRMVRSGLLRISEDVFFLSYSQVGEWLENPTQVKSYRLNVLTRRAQFKAFENADAPPNVFTFDGRRILHKSDVKQGEEKSTLEGLSASRGRATGIARIVKDPTKVLDLNPNDILVVPYADIAFTPMFLSATAIVVELGGPLSHAAIVAREYGIPTVVSVENATKRIREGSVITVDGNNGQVILSD